MVTHQNYESREVGHQGADGIDDANLATSFAIQAESGNPYCITPGIHLSSDSLIAYFLASPRGVAITSTNLDFPAISR